MSTGPTSHLTNVFVSGLPREVQADWLFDFFKEFGEIVGRPSVRTYENQATSVINFATHEMAEMAIANANYAKINGRMIYVQWPHEPGLYQSEANLVISNLPTNIEEPDLHSALEKFGPLLSLTIRRNKMGQSTGMGLAQFVNPADAKTALEELQGASIEGNTITIEVFKPADKRQDIITRLPGNVLAVDGQDITEAKLQELFGSSGAVINTTIIGGHGIVVFKDKAACSAALGQSFASKGYTLSTQVRKEDQQAVLRFMERRRVYISQIVTDDKEALQSVVEEVGPVGILEIHARGEERAAIAQYLTEEACQAAPEKLNGKLLPRQNIPIRVVPFFDKRLEHPSAGLLVVNEVPSDTKLETLREEFAKHGRILASSLTATVHGLCIASFLFEKSEDAVKAADGVVNGFVIENVELNAGISAFSENGVHMCIAIYDLPPHIERSEVNNLLFETGLVNCLWLGRGKSTTAFAYYNGWQSVERAMRVLRHKHYHVALLSAHFLIRLQALLDMFVPPDKGNILFVSGIGSTDSKALREIFSTRGKVTAAMARYSQTDGDTMGQGLVFYATKEEAQAALADMPIGLPPTATVARWQPRGTAPQAEHPAVAPVPLPIQRGVGGQNRDTLRQYIREMQLSEQQKKLLIEKVDGICLQDVRVFAANEVSFNDWIRQQIQ